LVAVYERVPSSIATRKHDELSLQEPFGDTHKNEIVTKCLYFGLGAVLSQKLLTMKSITRDVLEDDTDCLVGFLELLQHFVIACRRPSCPI
jgi:hypothetical protein